MKTALPTAAILLGIVFLVGSAVWAMVFPPSRVWTNEKSARMSELNDQADAIKLQLSKGKFKPGESAAKLQESYDKVSEEYKALHQEYLGATQSPKTAKSFLWWSGIAFIVAGTVVVFAKRDG
jgi:hypothetical protein